MILEGSLDAFSLPDVFALLSMTSKTGALHVRRDGVGGVVHFHDGKVTGAAADERDRALARRLVACGQLPDDALQAAVDAVVADPTRGLARAVADADALDGEVLGSVVSALLTDGVFDLLRWADGEFRFVIDEANPDDVGVARTTEEVLAEARARLESWKTLSDTLPSPEVVLSLAVAPASDPVLSKEEWGLLAFIDGRRSVAAVCALAGRGEFEVASALAGLVERGLLRVDEEDVSAALARRAALLAPLGGGPAGSDRSNGSSAALNGHAASGDPVPVEPGADPVQVSLRGGLGVDPMAGMSIDGTAAVAPSPLGAERDPGVNKSMLLRLIAGVRGL